MDGSLPPASYDPLVPSVAADLLRPRSAFSCVTVCVCVATERAEEGGPGRLRAR